MRRSVPIGLLGLSIVGLGVGYYLLCPIAPKSAATAEESSSPNPAWREAERGILENHVQLTFPDRFVRAGEAYFSPDETKIIFQAVETPTDGESEESNYQMYVADLARDGEGRITGLGAITRLSPPGSANTCGWFHPTKPNTVIFGSTIIAPSATNRPGYQRGAGRYVWSFPPEMTIVECDLDTADGTAATLKPIVNDPAAYLAECVIRSDGRYLVYCRREQAEGPFGGDLMVRDLETGEDITIAGHAGYDGGPFFSPDGRRLCYRSDRRGNDLLQVFVAELAFDEGGGLVGVDREFQLTDNEFVNWAPYWHPQGRHLIYTTSAHGHKNYEVYILDADRGGVLSADAPAKYGTSRRRVTFAGGFDGLPAFNADGSLMMWTSQRDGSGTSQLWLADFVMPIDDEPGEAGIDARMPEPQPRQPDVVHVTEPETGTIYVYDPATHAVSIYNPATHEVREVTDDAGVKRAMALFRAKERDGGSDVP